MKEIVWEYKTRYFGSHERPMRMHEVYLNREGKDGWELVQVIIERMINEPNIHANYTFYFKRAVIKDNNLKSK